MRYRIKQWTMCKTTMRSLAWILRKLNPLLRGYGHFYRHCTGAKRTLLSLDWYVGERLLRWMRKKYPAARVTKLLCSLRQSTAHPGCKVWQDGREEQFLVGYISVQRFRLGRMRRPDYAMGSGELSNERRMLSSGRGYGRSMVERPHDARSLLYAATEAHAARSDRAGNFSLQ